MGRSSTEWEEEEEQWTTLLAERWMDFDFDFDVYRVR